MRVMALDVGEKTIGVAVTDEMGWSAQGLVTIRRLGPKRDLETISSYIKDYGVDTLVVGLPLVGGGGTGLQARKVLRFVDDIKRGLAASHPGLIVETWDESMTTSEAHGILSVARVSSRKRKKVIDKLAAVFILESYLRGKGEV